MMVYFRLEEVTWNYGRWWSNLADCYLSERFDEPVKMQLGVIVRLA